VLAIDDSVSMIAGDCEVGLQAAPDDDDTLKFLELLFQLKLHDTPLCERTTGDLVRQCLDKFDDDRATLDCRAISLYTLAAQIDAGNSAMLVHIPDIGRRLKDASVLALPVAAGAEGFHRQVPVVVENIDFRLDVVMTQTVQANLMFLSVRLLIDDFFLCSFTICTCNLYVCVSCTFVA